MGALVLRCGKLFDGVSDQLTGPMEILVEGIVSVRSASRYCDHPGRRRSIFRSVW